MMAAAASFRYRIETEAAPVAENFLGDGDEEAADFCHGVRVWAGKTFGRRPSTVISNIVSDPYIVDK